MNETISIIRTKEGRRSVMLETQVGDGSALVTKTTKFKESRPMRPTESTSKKADPFQPSNKDSLLCNYCKRHRHTRNQCWKLNGKPPKNNRSSNNRGQAHMASTMSNEEIPQCSISKFKEEIVKLKTLLGSLEKASSIGTCSLVLSGTGHEEDYLTC